MIRPPAVAGTFYPSDPASLRAVVEECLDEGVEREPAVALLAPHAGYIYSGPCAGSVYSTARLPRRIVVLCPNHTGRGAPLSIVAGGSWETPLGRVEVDGEIASGLLAEDPEISEDAEAHRREHSLEVQLPFLQVLRPGFLLTPLCVGTQDHGRLNGLGEALSRVIRTAGEPALIVISSDMSHYIPAETARRLDAMAIEAMVSVDPDGLHDVVRRERISMCGIAPAVAGLRAARELGARRGRLVAYTNSGDRTGDSSEVVAYAGLIFG